MTFVRNMGPTHDTTHESRHLFCRTVVGTVPSEMVRFINNILVFEHYFDTTIYYPKSLSLIHLIELRLSYQFLQERLLHRDFDFEVPTVSFSIRRHVFLTPPHVSSTSSYKRLLYASLSLTEQTPSLSSGHTYII